MAEWFTAHPFYTGLIGLICTYGIGVLLKNGWVYKIGNKIGKALRYITLEKLGDKQGSKVLDHIGNTLTMFFSGISDGTAGKDQYAKKS